MKTDSSAWRLPLSALLVLAGLVVISAVAFVVARSATSTATYTCQATLRLAPGTTAAPGLPAPWRASIVGDATRPGDEAHPLTGIGAFDGPPDQGGAPVSHSSNGAGTVVHWTFSGTFARGKWLACEYGAGVLRAVREAAPETTSCEAQLTRADSRKLTGARFHCR